MKQHAVDDVSGENRYLFFFQRNKGRETIIFARNGVFFSLIIDPLRNNIDTVSAGSR